MNIEEVEEPETTKIYRQNPFTPAAAKPKLRKFTDETNMQARNHEICDEFRTQPIRHLDLATPAFYYYRKNPKCYHTVWGTFPQKKHWESPNNQTAGYWVSKLEKLWMLVPRLSGHLTHFFRCKLWFGASTGKKTQVFPIMNAILGHDLLDLGQKNPCVYRGLLSRGSCVFQDQFTILQVDGPCSKSIWPTKHGQSTGNDT